MILLGSSIVFTLIVVIGLPIAAGFWLNKKLGVPWSTITYGVLGYLMVQAAVSIIYTGMNTVIEGWNTAAADQNFLLSQILFSVFLGALLGVIVRWLGMKKLKYENRKSAYGVGVGYGGAEGIMLVGLPLLMTFITMVSNLNIDPQTTTLEPEVIRQLEELWALEFYIPLATAIERFSALVMYITSTMLIYQVFKKNNLIWLGAAFGLEFLINGLVVGLSEAGLHYGWVILLVVLLMAGNIYILYRLKAFDFDVTPLEEESSDHQDQSENPQA
jgi:uncharacterized membrane protein YhfC